MQCVYACLFLCVCMMCVQTMGVMFAHDCVLPAYACKCINYASVPNECAVRLYLLLFSNWKMTGTPMPDSYTILCNSRLF